MAISQDVVAQLSTLLKAISRLVMAGVELNEEDVRTIVLAAGLDPSPEALRELLHWSDLLRTLKWQPSPALRDGTFEALRLRGLPRSVVSDVLDAVSAKPTLGSAAGRNRNTEEALLLPGATPNGTVRGIGQKLTLLTGGESTLTHELSGPVHALLRFGLPLAVLLGLILRIWLATTQSAWLDEAWSLQKMARVPLASLYSVVKLDDTKPPLYYAVLHVWLALTGFGVIQARLLSVLIGTATIPALYLLTKVVFDKTTALVAALLLAISPIATWYSDEIRMYAATSLFAVLAAYLLLRAAQERQVRWWAGYVACGALSLNLDLTGASLLLAVQLFYVVSLARRRVPFWPWLVSSLSVMVLAVPTLLLLRFQMADHGGAIEYQAPTAHDVWLSILDLISLNGDRFWVGLAFAALLLVGLIGLLHDYRDRCLRNAYVLLALMAIIPFAVPLALDAIHPVFVTRTVQAAVYGLLILFARGIVILLRTRIPAGVLAMVAVASLNATSLHAAAATTLKEDWKGLASYASRQVSSDSLIMIDPSWLLDPFNLYWQSYHRRIAQHDYPPINSASTAAGVFKGYRSIWLVTYDTGVNPPVDTGTEYLQAHYVSNRTLRFSGIALRHYVALATRAGITLRALPNHVKDGAYTLVQVDTMPGAVCGLRIVYDIDRRTIGWLGADQSTGKQGTAAWRVRVITNGSAGIATVSCRESGHTIRGNVRLFVAH